MTSSNRKYLDRLKAEVMGMSRKLQNLSKSYDQKQSRLATQQARAERREDLEHVAQSLRVPRAQGGNAFSTAPRPPRPEEVDANVECRELACDEALEEMTEPNPGGADNEEQAEWNPLLAAWGHAFISATFQAWWENRLLCLWQSD